MSPTVRVLVLVQALVIGVLLVMLFLRTGEAALPATPPGAPNDTAASAAPVPAATSLPERGAPAPGPGPARHAVDAAATSGPPDDALGVVCYGTVTDGEGKPIDGVNVMFTPPDAKRGIHTRTERGGYALTGLKPGPWKLATRAEGCKPLEKEVVLASQSPQRLDLQLERAVVVLVKIVTPEGRPLHEVLLEQQKEKKLDWSVDVGVLATRTQPVGDFPLTEHSALHFYGVGEWRPSQGRGAGPRDGRKLPPKEYAGELQLNVPPPVFVSAVLRNVVLATALAEAGQGEVTLEVSLDALHAKLCKVRLQVVDAETGQPLSEARVGLHDRQSGGAGQAVGADGRIAFENQRPGLLVLEINAKDREYAREYVRLEPGKEHDLGIFPLAKSVTAKGLVVDAHGKPATGVTLSYRRVDRIQSGQPWDLGTGVAVNGSGEFQLGAVGRGRYVVSGATAEGAAGYVVVDTTAGPVENARLVVTPGTTVKLENRGGRDASLFVTIKDAHGTPVGGQRVQGGFDRSLTLAAGRYTFEIHDDQKLVRSETVNAAGQPLTVRVP